MTIVKSFPLPDLGEGLTEADLLTWLVAVGDTIELNQNIAEVETAKAAVELPSPFAGVVAALRVSEGDTVEVGTPIIDITVEGVEQPVADQAEERIPVLVGYGVAAEGASRRRGRSGPSADSDSAVSGAASIPGASDVSDTAPTGDSGRPDQEAARNSKPLASPPVRLAARDALIDLAEVTPTGPHGNVTGDDLAHHRGTSDTAPTVRGGETRTAIKGVRKHTADAMVRSAFTAPHVTEFVTVDVTASLELLDSLKSAAPFADVRLTPLALVSKAVLVTLKSNPSLNSSWDEQAQEIVTKHYVNLGIAAATPRGLMVPNIKNAHEMGLVDIARSLSELTRTAKEGKSGPEDLSGGTITITNVGVFGIDAGTPILNPGEAAIVCFGAIRRQPWEFEGGIALRSVTTLSLSFDHRLVDGQQGSEFLSLVGRMLSDPLNLIALS